MSSLFSDTAGQQNNLQEHAVEYMTSFILSLGLLTYLSKGGSVCPRQLRTNTPLCSIERIPFRIIDGATAPQNTEFLLD